MLKIMCIDKIKNETFNQHLQPLALALSDAAPFAPFSAYLFNFFVFLFFIASSFYKG